MHDVSSRQVVLALTAVDWALAYMEYSSPYLYQDMGFGVHRAICNKKRIKLHTAFIGPMH
jgi:hypothetical protein